MRLAVDVATPSGIDRSTVESALGVAATADLHLTLVGDPTMLETAVGDAVGVDIVAATSTIGPGEDPAVVRGRPQSSIRVAVDLLRDRVDALVSVAPAPVVAAAAAFVLGRSRGHRRPTLAARVGGTTVVDAGAAAAATTSDLAVAVAAVAGGGARVGLLTPVGSAPGRLDEFAALLAATGSRPAEVREVDVATALSGAVDVVACPGALGATLVGTARAVGAGDVDRSLTVVGVPATVVAVPAGARLDGLFAELAGPPPAAAHREGAA